MEIETWRPGADAIARDWRYEQKPGPATEQELKFQRQPMVKWLDPKQLTGTAMQTLLSSIFGSYADRRETQAALSHAQLHVFDDEQEIWIDYTADLGDGFNATFTVASQLAAEIIELDGRTLPRGRILVLGGDQVYPAPARDEYRNRFSGPYEAALPSCTEGEHPYLFAIPGNHDWYDGLASFLRLFCQKRWIGGWRTAQSRSYFALQLPHRWWLLGTDFQLHSDLDQPQLDYFCVVAEQMKPGDRLILCTPEPSWVHVVDRSDTFDNLAFFEREVVRRSGAVVALTIAGDLHHYARYASRKDDEQRITAGGGGAYLYPTQGLPQAVALEHGDGASTHYDRKAVFPGTAESTSRRAGAVWAFRKNPGFSMVLAGFYALYAWILQSASRTAHLGRDCLDFMNCAAKIPVRSVAGLPSVLGMFVDIVKHAPLLMLLTIGVITALHTFCQADPGRSRKLKWLGVLHGVMHILLVVVLTWIFARVNAGTGTRTLGLEIESLWQMLLFALEMAVIGGILGGMLFGTFLLLGVNLNEAYSAQQIEDFRNFLRLHIDPAGVLTVYSVGIRRAAKWKFRPNAPAGQPRYEVDGEVPRPELIEEPIVISTVYPRATVERAGAISR